ncbi:MAG TPA: 2-C-methyl-D-erythritol 2,4-cyclodiphosphate synthase [Gemmatimonadales bacterium]|nr:2-C-methyl-D-erythritol 2,4-cyclodiphosphate synthase [Gemmatimonadales bacterium]
MIRVGIGYDSHRFAEGRPLVLGGCTVPSARGLAGHSDADALTHAVIDAVLGAAKAGNIGQLFPDTDPAWKDADSIVLLRGALERVRARGWTVAQVDATIVTEAPKLNPHVAAMERRLAEELGVGVDCVSVKAKTNEGLGWIGRGEGLAVMAIATLAALGAEAR